MFLCFFIKSFYASILDLLLSKPLFAISRSLAIIAMWVTAHWLLCACNIPSDMRCVPQQLDACMHMASCNVAYQLQFYSFKLNNHCAAAESVVLGSRNLAGHHQRFKGHMQHRQHASMAMLQQMLGLLLSSCQSRGLTAAEQQCMTSPQLSPNGTKCEFTKLCGSSMLPAAV